MDGHLKDIREESVELCNLPTADGHSKEMLIQSIEGVKQGATSLTEMYQKLMKLCQQKRDLYIVAVKFHMTVRQVNNTCTCTCIRSVIHDYMCMYMYRECGTCTCKCVSIVLVFLLYVQYYVHVHV